MYDAVLFDMDGVLVEPTRPDTAREAIEQTFREFDVEPRKGDVDALLNVSVERVEEVCRRHSLDVDDFWRVRERRIAEAQTASFDDGGKQPYHDVGVVEELNGSTLAVVSNNQQPTVDHVVDGLGYRDRFEAVHARGPTVDDLRRKKPSPYLLESALSDIDAEDALYVGDREKDVVAAERAGVDSALVRRSHNRDLEPEKSPDHVLEALDSVLNLL